MRVRYAFLAALAAAAMTSAVEARTEPDAATRAKSFDVLLRRLDHYVFPEKAQAVRERLLANRAAHLAAPDTASFIEAVNADLLATSRDKHLHLFLHDDGQAPADRADAGYGIARAG
ncbi:MAG TPA: hypothetical protein VF636_06915 [Sphingomonas sp.]|jgi:hypothetical protein